MTGPPSGGSDEERFARYADALIVAVDAAVGPWVRRVVLARLGSAPTPQLEERIERAAVAARADVVPRLRELLAADVDRQWTNPLSILRAAVVHPGAVLAEAGVAPVERDATSRRIHPDDHYDLAPAAFADLSDDVHEAGIMWGAAKAHIHLRRHGGRSGAPAPSPGEAPAP